MEVLVNNEPIDVDDNINNAELERNDENIEVNSNSQLEHALR